MTLSQEKLEKGPFAEEAHMEDLFKLCFRECFSGVNFFYLINEFQHRSASA